MLATARRLRDDEHLSLREIASRLVIRTGKKRGQHPDPATVMRMLREHDDQTARLPRSAFWPFPAVSGGITSTVPVMHHLCD